MGEKINFATKTKEDLRKVFENVLGRLPDDGIEFEFAIGIACKTEQSEKRADFEASGACKASPPVLIQFIENFAHTVNGSDDEDDDGDVVSGTVGVVRCH